MAGSYITRANLRTDTLDWGTTGWVSRPSSTGASHLTVMEVTLTPGNGHNFHKHPDQEEVIYVVEGAVEQWLEKEHTMLGPGEAVFIPADLVHASFNVGNGTAKLLVTLGPCIGDGGYDIVDVSDQAPWNGLR